MLGLSLMFYMEPYRTLDSWRPEYAVFGGLIDVTGAKERWLHELWQACLGGGFVPNDVTSCPDRRNGNDCSYVVDGASHHGCGCCRSYAKYASVVFMP